MPKEPFQPFLPGTALSVLPDVTSPKPLIPGGSPRGSNLIPMDGVDVGALQGLHKQLGIVLGASGVETVGDAMEWAKEHLSPQAAPSTRTQYLRHYGCLGELLAEVRLADLDNAHLAQVMERWPGPEHRLVIRTLQSVVRKLQKAGSYNGPVPFLDFNVRMESRERPLSIQEARLVLQSCREEANLGTWRPACSAIVLSLFTGSRCRSEILPLEWSWVREWKLKGGQRRAAIHVPANKTKTQRRRVIPLSDPAIAVLDEMRSLGLSDTWIFPRKSRTGPVGYAVVHRAWTKICKRARLTDVRLHDLRHTTATELARLGLDIRTIAEILGHRSLSSTQGYVHAADLDRRVDALNEIGLKLAT